MEQRKNLRHPAIERQTQLLKANIYRQMHAGTFPKAVKEIATENNWPLDGTGDSEQGGDLHV